MGRRGASALSWRGTTGPLSHAPGRAITQAAVSCHLRLHDAAHRRHDADRNGSARSQSLRGSTHAVCFQGTRAVMVTLRGVRSPRAKVIPRGTRIGRLVVIGTLALPETAINRCLLYLCACDCGGRCRLRGSVLRLAVRQGAPLDCWHCRLIRRRSVTNRAWLSRRSHWQCVGLVIAYRSGAYTSPTDRDFCQGFARLRDFDWPALHSWALPELDEPTFDGSTERPPLERWSLELAQEGS